MGDDERLMPVELLPVSSDDVVSAIDALLGTLSDTHPWVRASAVRAIVHAGVLPAAMIDDPDPYVRMTVVESLGLYTGITSEIIESILEKAILDSDSSVRCESIIILESSRINSSVELISRMLSDKHQDVRNGAIAALGRIGGKDALRSLMGVLDDPNYHVRRAAILAVGSIVREYSRGMIVIPQYFVYKFWNRKDSL